MTRDCLLSKSYTGNPLKFKGEDIHYSPIANDILREFKTAFFHGADDQTDFSGLAEGVMIMDLLRENNLARINELREMPREKRHREVLTFSLDNEAEITRLQPVIIERVQAAMSASVESEAGGKSHSQAPDSSPT